MAVELFRVKLFEISDDVEEVTLECTVNAEDQQVIIDRLNPIISGTDLKLHVKRISTPYTLDHLEFTIKQMVK